jgi:hypothetical protein
LRGRHFEAMKSIDLIHCILFYGLKTFQFSGS